MRAQLQGRILSVVASKPTQVYCGAKRLESTYSASKYLTANELSTGRRETLWFSRKTRQCSSFGQYCRVYYQSNQLFQVRETRAVRRTGAQIHRIFAQGKFATRREVILNLPMITQDVLIFSLARVCTENCLRSCILATTMCD